MAVGLAAGVDRRWVLRWKEAVNETPAAVCGLTVGNQRAWERGGLSGEEGDGAMGVREKKIGRDLVVAAVFCVM